VPRNTRTLVLFPEGVSRLAKSKFQKSGILENKSGVYQERFSSKSGEKSGGFLLVFKSYHIIVTT
jgi:hypothetical protein